MTQLAASVDANDDLWTLDALPVSPFLQVEDELVEVRSRFPEHVYLPTNETIPPKIRVNRAAAGTTAASHANGTALTAVYIPSTGTGGVQQLRRVGPIVVAFDTVPDHVSGGGGVKHWFLMDAVANGAWVVKATIHKLTAWNDGTSCSGQLYIDDADTNVGEPIGPLYDLNGTSFQYGATNDYPVTGGPHPGQTGSDSTVTGQSDNVVVRGEGLSLWVQVGVSDDDATQGLLHAYALIAEPAS